MKTEVDLSHNNHKIAGLEFEHIIEDTPKEFRKGEHNEKETRKQNQFKLRQVVQSPNILIGVDHNSPKD